MNDPIYLDYQSTTPVDPRVLEAMLPYFGEHFGNAASRTHAFGWRAQEAVERARGEVGRLLGSSSREIIFTSGATESNNLALRGVVGAIRDRGAKGNHIVTSQIEHHAILDPCKVLEKEGYRLTFLKPDRYGRISADQVAGAITDDTVLVSIMTAHNEIGTLYPIAEMGQVCRERGVLFHTDAAQAVGKIPVNVDDLHVDLLSLSGHKLYAPKGIGTLYVRGNQRRLPLKPLVYGGGHERGLRSGTLNVPAIVGLGEACRISLEELHTEAERLRGLRDTLYDSLIKELDDVTLNGHPQRRLPGNLNLSFGDVEGESLLMGLKNLAVSSGSACTSQVPEPSYVLRAIGVPKDLAHSSLRFGLGRFTTREEIDIATDSVIRTVRRLREVSRTVRQQQRGKNPKKSVAKTEKMAEKSVQYRSD